MTPICKGDWSLGTACGECRRCTEAAPVAVAMFRKQLQAAERAAAKDTMQSVIARMISWGPFVVESIRTEPGDRFGSMKVVVKAQNVRGLGQTPVMLDLSLLLDLRLVAEAEQRAGLRE